MKKDSKNKSPIFFKNNPGIKSGVFYIFFIFSAALLILFILEAYLIRDNPDERIVVHEDILGEGGELKFRDHPYFGYQHYKQKTKDPCPDKEGDFLVHIYGGSTVFAGGKRGSISHHLWSILCDEGVGAEVKNFGQGGYVSTQETNRMIQQLRMGERPDLVIFYNGFNDKLITKPGFPQIFMTEKVFNYFNYNNNNIFPRTLKFIYSNIPKKERASGSGDSIDYFSYDFIKTGREGEDQKELVDIYFENARIIKSIADTYGFESLIYWQPNLTTKKNLSIEERVIIKNSSKKITQIEEAQKEFKSRNKTGLVTDLSNLFDNHLNQVYVDLIHKKPAGNKAVAERMMEDVIYLVSGD